MNIEYKSARFLSAIAPFSAAFIPAYLLYVNAQDKLGFPLWAAVITAIAAEAIGASAITIYYKAKQHNAYYTSDKNQINANRALWAYGIYLGAILTVNALLEAGVSSIIANVFLSLLSLSGALLLSVHYQIGEVKERYKKPKITESVQKPVKEVQKAIEKVLKYDVRNKNDLTEEMKVVLKDSKSMKDLQLIFPNVTERTLYNWKESLV